MSSFQPPPTWAMPVIVDERTQQSVFNPIWLKWFVDLASVLGASGSGTAGGLSHDGLSGLQGGTTGQRFHLTQSEYAKLPSYVPYTGAASNVDLGAYNLTTTGMYSNDNIVTPKTSGKGIQVDTAAPTFGWRDIIGAVQPKALGVGSPTRASYRGNLFDFAFALNDVVDFIFHIPHDWVPGTQMYFHVHWSHTGTAITGTATFTIYMSQAKGHNQANFGTERTIVISYATVNIATTPQYRHRIDETVMTSTGGSASTLDIANTEVDGLILATLKLTGLPTVTGGSLFIHTCDIHYQSTNMATKQKAPNFYV